MARVFISYSRRDLSFVDRLVQDLGRVGLDVWYDLSGLEGGERWGEKIQGAIRECECVIVVLSPDSVKSEWVEREFLFASNLKKKIIPLMYRECELPFNYLNLNYIDVQEGRYAQNLPKILKAIDSGLFAAGAGGNTGVRTSSRTTSPRPAQSNTIKYVIGCAVVGLAGLIVVAVAGFWVVPKLFPANPAAIVKEAIPTTLTPITVPTTPLAANNDVVATQPVPTITFAPTPPPTLKPSANFAGEWWTNFAVMNLQQTGNIVSGSYLQYGTSNWIQTEGKVENKILKGSANGYYYELTMNTSTTSFDGWWGDHFRWCGVQAGKPLPDGCGFSGKWNVGGKTWANGSTMILVQTGSKVSGSYTPVTVGVYDAQAEADLSNYGFDADGTWYVGNSSGTFHWNFPDRTYDKFIGYFHYSGDDTEYSWCGWRNGAGNPCP